MARFTCAFIKKDNTICGNKCCDPTGCYRHWKLYEKNINKKPCLVNGCGYHTDNDSGCCSKHSAKFYALKYRMRQKYGVDALQPRTPEAPISESDDEVRTLQPRIPEAPIFELSDRDGTLHNLWSSDFEMSDGVKTLQPRIYEAPGSESDDEDVGLDLFGD